MSALHRLRGRRFLSTVLVPGLLCSAASLPAQAPVSRIGPAALLGSLSAGSPSARVLVLATPHLRALGTDFHRGALDSLVALLTRFRPAVIAVEAGRPEAVARMAHGDSVDAQLRAAFAADPARWGDSLQARLALTWEAAAGAARLHDDSSLGNARRADLVPLLLASYDYYSALLNWAALAPAHDLPHGLTHGDTAALSAALATPNEIMALAVPLGLRLGLTRLTPFDDHLDDETLLRSGDLERLSAALRASPEVQAVQSDTFYTALSRHLAAGNAAGNLLPLYRYVNSAAYGARDVQLQWGLFLRTHLASGVDLRRLALWEARNLLMVSNLESALAEHPGARMLVIVGAAHKPFLDAFLGQVAGVRVTQLEDLR